MNTNKKYNKINTKEKRDRKGRKKERKTAEYCHIVVHVTNFQAIHYELS